MMFHVGQLVVALRGWTSSYYPQSPVKNRVYTVREIGVTIGIEWLRFSELINPTISWSNVSPREPAWESYFFRPLQDSRIAIFRAMLAPTPKVDA